MPTYNSAVSGTFSYALLNYFFLSTGDTFGSSTSPHEYEPFIRTRAFLAEYLSRDHTLVLKHQDILSLVKFVKDDNPDPAVFVQAIADGIHKGLFNELPGRDVNTPHNPFVDNTLMADIRKHMLTCMTASIEGLFQVMGLLLEKIRRSPLSMDKFSSFPRSWGKPELGLHINTIAISIALLTDKLLRFSTLKSTRYTARKSFTLL